MISVEKLSKLRLFAGISADALTRLGEAMQEKNFAAGETILREGEKTGSLFLIAKGSVSVETHAKVVARLEAEEFFGEMAFLDNQPHSASVVAAAPAMLYVLPRSAVDTLIKKEPSAAIDQMTALFAVVSSRLRHTTEELVTVYDVARLIGAASSFENLIRSVLERLQGALVAKSSVAFYRWNPFNDEYGLVSVLGPEAHAFPVAIETVSTLLKSSGELFDSMPDIKKSQRGIAPLSFADGHLILSRVNSAAGREGLFVYYNGALNAFDSGKRQVMETVTAVLAPALESARAREEEEARRRLAQSKQTYL